MEASQDLVLSGIYTNHTTDSRNMFLSAPQEAETRIIPKNSAMEQMICPTMKQLVLCNGIRIEKRQMLSLISLKWGRKG